MADRGADIIVNRYQRRLIAEITKMAKGERGKVMFVMSQGGRSCQTLFK